MRCLELLLLKLQSLLPGAVGVAQSGSSALPTSPHSASPLASPAVSGSAAGVGPMSHSALEAGTMRTAMVERASPAAGTMRPTVAAAASAAPTPAAPVAPVAPAASAAAVILQPTDALAVPPAGHAELAHSAEEWSEWTGEIEVDAEVDAENTPLAFPRRPSASANRLSPQPEPMPEPAVPPMPELPPAPVSRRPRKASVVPASPMGAHPTEAALAPSLRADNNASLSASSCEWGSGSSLC
ncbi:uncharacterized protein AMSG_00683 [Thecamonas trahens ATCC 50062]|uniref:Uncharacterized protein n=1 Tax=Thecamonas trahens ATCC 50062 TaxID=461836 RepID=A0A0L0DDW2_THETB|nr:hypothetical protein AMSG_00683 [Thecamonas trahens ATCC 50062]KNC50522.1 hypothetical protein AMSG_00683 [Thecamonas trahens ATCC 50062]|eukprot:XP_013762414.1 hypothetical protein AMSG_00683 [Thecamonas trahens ATCC 50062]